LKKKVSIKESSLKRKRHPLGGTDKGYVNIGLPKNESETIVNAENG
jgi:hypothetical protein